MLDWLTNNWFTQKANEIIWSFIYGLAEDFLNDAFKLITDFIILETDVNKFYNVDRYMIYFYILAASLLSVVVTWKIFKQVSGNMIPTEQLSLGTLTKRVVWAGTLIYFLPWSLINIFLRVNNLLIQFIQNVGVDITPDTFNSLNILSAANLTRTLLLTILVLGIAFLVLGIVAGIRYVEIIISYIVAPFVAISVINGTDGINIWVRETFSIVFTQALHVFLLEFLISILKLEHFFSNFIAIGVLVIMIRGPKVIRKYVYSTGTGSSTVAAAGAAGRLGAMKMVLKTAKPV